MGTKPGSGTATNNDDDYLSLKVNLRIKSLPARENIEVLECFAGDGVLWDLVKSTSKINIKRTRVDINQYAGNDFTIDSLIFLQNNDVSKYDVIDLDSWGSCVKHLEILFQKKYKGIVHCTYCTPIPLNPDKILAVSFFRFDHEIIMKAQSLFAKDTGSMLMNYLSGKGIKKVFGHVSKQKNYFYFEM